MEGRLKRCLVLWKIQVREARSPLFLLQGSELTPSISYNRFPECLFCAQVMSRTQRPHKPSSLGQW